MQITFLSGYNNYQSRKLIYKTTYEDYLGLDGLVVATISNVNFVPGDGVTTTQVFNNGLDVVPDYAVVATDAGELVSRWFVVEYTRTRNGQYNVGLYRDVVADALETVEASTAFITKANVPANNPLVYNNENLDLNQIKVAEHLIKDNSACPWIIGYYARKDGDGNIRTMSGAGVSVANQQVNFVVDDLSKWPYYQYKTTPFITTPKTIRLDNPINLYAEPDSTYHYIYQTYWFDVATNSMTQGGSIKTRSGPKWNYSAVNRLSLIDKDVPAQIKPLSATIINQAKSILAWKDVAATTTFLSLNGQIVLDSSDNHAYRIKVVSAGTSFSADVPINSNLDTTLKTAYTNAGCASNSTDSRGNSIIVAENAQGYKIELEYLPSATLNYDISVNRRFTIDAPYDIFAIPYSNTFKFTSNGTTITCSAEVALSVASDLGLSSDVYDLQLLPYCPFDTSGWPTNTYTSTDTTEFSWITGSDNTKLGVIFNVGSSSRTFSVTAPTTSYLQPTNPKLSCTTTFARLVSPNYNGEFQFTPARNNGVNYFNVDQTLKPFQPYIHVAPNWGGLYGSNFGDARGLVCGGDFSLPRTASEWQNYELSNKNYQVMFDRQISNMEFNNRIQQQQEVVSAIAGTVTGIGSGAAGGAIIGGGVGGVIGGAIGGLASGITGIADVGLNNALRAEAIDYTKDQFGFQLGNIKARPNSLTKVGALNANNKLWPFIEIWTCTEEEQRAVAYKIAYNGMNVGVVDQLSNWLYNDWSATIDGVSVSSCRFVQAKLITFPGLNDESHFARTLANEMNIGKFWLGKS